MTRLLLRLDLCGAVCLLVIRAFRLVAIRAVRFGIPGAVRWVIAGAVFFVALGGLGAALFPFPAAAQDDPPPAPTPQWRPVYHYAPQKNWTNDPNGLLYHDGQYLLYNQYNPFGYHWGHMSWGHAVSTNLIDWNELPVAIPEIMGTDTVARFSGSAVWDRDNTSGFCTNPKGCLVAIYTADQPAIKRESQFIAYSNDDGRSFTNYPGNPVIDLHMRDFRDPNVIWLKQQKEWLMTVALPHEHKVRFYGSHDLKNWELLSEFGGDQGDTRRIWECPSLSPLPVDGDPSKTKWVLMVSSGNPEAKTGMQYFVGDFDGRTFTNANPAATRLFVDYGSTFYAAIPWNGLPAGEHILLGWLVPGATPTYPWTGQMSIPRDLSLRTTAEGIRLFQEPAATVRTALAKRARVMKRKDLPVPADGVDLKALGHLKGNAYWLKLVAQPTDFSIHLAARTATSGLPAQETIIGYDAANHRLYIDKTHSGGRPNAEDSVIHYVPVAPSNGQVSLEILLDNASLEVFAGDGAAVYTTMIYPDPGSDGLSVKGAATTIKELTVWDLNDKH